MRARARYNVFYGPFFYSAGQEFDISEDDAIEMSKHCELLGESKQEPQDTETTDTEKKRGRRKLEAD